MAMGNHPSQQSIIENEDAPLSEKQGSQPAKDEVAMVSRAPDGSDAQPNPTVRILGRKESKAADEAQLAMIEKD
jgi:hypothetical protein